MFLHRLDRAVIKKKQHMDQADEYNKKLHMKQ